MRIHVLGASGSGVTTLGQELASRLQIPVFDADDYYWKKTDPPFVEPNSVAVRHERLLADIGPHDSWIITGSLVSWSEPFDPLFTHVIFLHVPAEARVRRLLVRERQRYGDKILPGGLMHAHHVWFIEWAAQYEEGRMSGRSLAMHERWLANCRSPVLRIEGEMSLSEVADISLRFVRGQPPL